MMFLSLHLLTALLVCSTHAIQIKPSYGPPSLQREPHREYGLPQQMPFREYGPPALKYVPPKLNSIGGSGSFSGLNEQIKNHYGAPKPVYGPPHKIQQQYNPPAALIAPPANSFNTHGPIAQSLQQKPQHVSPTKQILPLFQPATQFKPHHQPASSYGPPPSGPLKLQAKPIFVPPQSIYGPPPLPNFSQKPQTTIIVAGGQDANIHHQQQRPQQQQQTQHHQVLIQVDPLGNTHSVAGSQTPFHTACEGWKPIPSPGGAFIENNHIDTQSGYSQVSQTQVNSAAASSHSTTQYSGSSSLGHATSLGSPALGSSSNIGGSNLVDGLSDEQLVAIALQSSNFDAKQAAEQKNILPSTGPGGDFNKNSINSIEAHALQLPAGVSDSYTNPPSDSYAHGLKYSKQFHQQSSSQFNSNGAFSVNGAGGSFRAPQILNNKYGPPSLPSNNYGPPARSPSKNYGPPVTPNNKIVAQHTTTNAGNFGPAPLPPSTNYLPPPPSENFLSPPSSATNAAALTHQLTQAALGIQYGKQSGNLGPFPSQTGGQPSKPVIYRPPVPQGLFETIGATVQHLDKFGVKPQIQAPNYIPPAAGEIPQNSASNLNIVYPNAQQQQQIPEGITQQQLPQQSPANVFIQIDQQRQHHQHSQQNGNAHTEYGVPPLPPAAQQGPPQTDYLSPPPQPAQLPQQYLPPQSISNHQQVSSGASYSSSFDSSAFATTQYNHGQQQITRYHNCGQGPNFKSDANFNYHQQPYSSGSGTSISQSIPLAEQHTQFIAQPGTSYGPPPSGGNELDNIGYASQKSQVTALPDGTSPEGLPGLDGLNVLSAKKSEAIHLSSQETKSGNTYQVQYGESGQETANHGEILSADLLQAILNVVEQPQQQHQPLPANHKAENRSDIEIESDPADSEDEDEPGVAIQNTKNVKGKSKLGNVTSSETAADVQEIRPIVVNDDIKAKN